jgi:hypothetical protein
LVEVEVVAAEDSVVAVVGMAAYVVKRCWEGSHEKGREGEGEKLEQQKVVLQDGRATGNRARRNLPGKRNASVDHTAAECVGGGEGDPETVYSGLG